MNLVIGRQGMNIHLVNDDKWILGIIARQLLEIETGDIKIDRSNKMDPDADINYYLNWQRFINNIPKSNFDIIWFSHLCGEDEILALRKADLIIAKSTHGKNILKDLGFSARKIKIFNGIGSSTNKFKKINIGFAGRLCYKKRKGEDELFKLAKELNKEIFKFYLFGNESTLIKFSKELSNIADVELIKSDIELFFNTIDYYLQCSHVEGGSMDIINAINTGTPIISRDIGFFHDFKTEEDFLYSNFDQLLKYFRKIESSKLAKIERSKINIWDNFREWHIDLFKELNGNKRA